MPDTAGFHEPDVIFFPPKRHESLLTPRPELGDVTQVPARGWVCHQGDMITSVYYVIDGLLQYTTASDEGDIKIMGFLSPGCLFGEGPVLYNRPSRMSVMAVQPSTLLVIPRAKLLAELVADPSLAVTLVQSMGDKMYAFTKQLEQISFLEPRTRIINLLLALHGRLENLPEMTHGQIAEIVGCNRVTVTRILNQLRSQGLIEVQQKGIVVCDAERLQAALG